MAAASGASIQNICSMSFISDWGPGGEWGLIKTQKVYGASSCPGGGSGVVVDCHCERPHGTRAGVGGEVRQDAELSAV